MPEDRRVFDDRFLLLEDRPPIDGGMARINFVSDLRDAGNPLCVMKVCVLDDEEGRNRFRREVRLMEQINSPLVAQILHLHLTEGEDRPYFIMPYYEQGDLTSLIPTLISNYAHLEEIISRLLDCLQVLHERGVFHRDIKPENFLAGEDGVVIADLGLSVEPSSATHLTRVSLVGVGTESYAPPEFYEPGGFANATAASDIYSLGKTIYKISTNNHPLHPRQSDLPLPFWTVLKKCWNNEPAARYQSVDELRVALTQAFDLVLGRNPDAMSRSQELVNEIERSFENTAPLITELIPLLQSLPEQDFRNVSDQMRDPFINKFLANSSSEDISELIRIYDRSFREGNYSFDHVDPLANAMLAIFEAETTTIEHKVEAFELNLHVAKECHRYHAMDRCIRMLSGTNDESLALQLIPYLTADRASFICSRRSTISFRLPRIRQAVDTLCQEQSL